MYEKYTFGVHNILIETYIHMNKYIHILYVCYNNFID